MLLSGRAKAASGAAALLLSSLSFLGNNPLPWAPGQCVRASTVSSCPTNVLAWSPVL